MFLFQNIAHVWPESALQPYQMTFCSRKDATQPVSVIFGSSTSLRALQLFIFGANFTEKLVFFSKYRTWLTTNQCWNLIKWQQWFFFSKYRSSLISINPNLCANTFNQCLILDSNLFDLLGVLSDFSDGPSTRGAGWGWFGRRKMVHI